MSREFSAIRWCSFSLIAGGTLLIAKGGSILLGGQQPPLVYETGQTLFAVGLFGLVFLLRQPTILGRVGAGLALLAGFCGAAVVAGEVAGVAHTGANQFVLPWSLFYLGLGPGAMIALIMLGVAVLRNPRTQSRHATPLLVGILPLPMLVTALIHIEIPIVVVGASWAWLGLWLHRRSPNRSAGVAAIAPQDRA